MAVPHATVGLFLMVMLLFYFVFITTIYILVNMKIEVICDISVFLQEIISDPKNDELINIHKIKSF